MSAKEGKIVIVQPPCGPIKGVIETSPFGYEYASFYDIPYAKPPLGPLRFRDPEVLEPWTDLLDVSESAPNTIEAQTLNEDCLRLNVYTKNSRLECELQPVMLFITGGFFLRSPKHKDVYGPQFLLQKDVLFVNFSYRTGALGFLSSDDPEVGVPGNAGLKDQVMALRWVQENIAAFGGDPRDVTLFGYSAGGCSVHYQTISPLSKDLFHKAIIMSGTAFYVRGYMPKLRWTTRLARKLGWIGKDHEEASAFEYLRKIDVATIKANEETILTDEERQNGLPSIYGPTLEAYRSRMTMIPEPPEEMMKHAWSHSMPLMIGGTQNEGLLSYKNALENPNIWKTINENPSSLIPYNLTQDPRKRKAYGERMKLFYFGNENASAKDLDAYIFLQGDISYWHSNYKALIGRLKYPEVGVRGPTWLYNFAYDSPEWYKYRVSIPARGFPGVAHADDMLFLLHNDAGYGIPRTGSSDYYMMKLMVEIYTSFAINGDPNNDLLRKVMGKWEAVSCLSPTICCSIDNSPEMMELPEKWRVIFWDMLYDEEKKIDTLERRLGERRSLKTHTFEYIMKEDLYMRNSCPEDTESQRAPDLKKVNCDLILTLLPIPLIIMIAIIYFLLR